MVAVSSSYSLPEAGGIILVEDLQDYTRKSISTLFYTMVHTYDILAALDRIQIRENNWESHQGGPVTECKFGHNARASS